VYQSRNMIHGMAKLKDIYTRLSRTQSGVSIDESTVSGVQYLHRHVIASSGGIDREGRWHTLHLVEVSGSRSLHLGQVQWVSEVDWGRIGIGGGSRLGYIIRSRDISDSIASISLRRSSSFNPSPKLSVFAYSNSNLLPSDSW
ncbi:hypothetical protein PFISCL1PPCAC_29024, partial [Pristionchus fissidentatus]